MDTHFVFEGTAFVWNAEKAKSNISKHGITFQQAAEVFFDPMFQLVNANRNDESRDAILGFDRSGKSLFVVHIEVESSSIRIISARLMTASERKQYGNS